MSMNNLANSYADPEPPRRRPQADEETLAIRKRVLPRTIPTRS